MTLPKRDSTFAYQAPWHAVREFGEQLEKQLIREVPKGHVLYSLRASAIARRMDTDDVLFELDDRFAVVHLTWSASAQSDQRWPHTEIYTSFHEWIEKRMIPDSQMA